MPKYKYAAFATVIGGFIALIILCVVMTYPRYQKSMEQLPELIEMDASVTNEALLKIRQGLDEIGTQENIVWTGSVCASKYKTLAGSEKIYYVCPYIVVQAAELKTGETSDWRLSLCFLVSALKDGELCDLDTNIHLENTQFDMRFGENASIISVGYGDGEMNDVNGPSVSYQFRDRDKVNDSTKLFTRLSVQAAVPEGKSLPKDGETAVVNWSFSIREQNHVIGLFDDVQVEIPYLFSK